MRTAEEHYEIATGKNLSNFNCTRMDIIIEAINEARKEAIEECAKRVEFNLVQEGCPSCENTIFKVDKQSILSLINELK